MQAVITEIGQNDAPLTSTAAAEWVWLVCKPLLISLGVIAAGAMLLLLVPPTFGLVRSYNTRTLSKTLEGDALAAAIQTRQDAAIRFGLLLVTAGASVGAGFVGSSYLLGAFAAGMAFSKLEAPDGCRAEELLTVSVLA